MNFEDAIRILSKPEGTKIEFKKARNSVSSSLYETVVSFSNTDGGTIILGAEDDGSVIGIESGFVEQVQTDLIITEHEVNFTNPNKALFHGPIDPSSFNPYAKNPNIRKFFTAFGWTDEIGSGIRNTNKYMPLYVPGVKPLFIENDTFKTEIPLVFVTLGHHTKPLTEWLDLPSAMMDKIQPALRNISLPSQLANKEWNEVLLHLVPCWHRNGTLLLNKLWPENQPFTRRRKISVPSSSKNGTLQNKKVPGWIQKGAKQDKKIYADYQENMKEEMKKVPGRNKKETARSESV